MHHVLRSHHCPESRPLHLCSCATPRARFVRCAGTTVLGDVNLAATFLNCLVFFLGTFTFALILGVITEEVGARCGAPYCALKTCGPGWFL